MDISKEEQRIRQKTKDTRNKVLTVIGVILVAGCFIPFQRDTKSDVFEDGYHESYEYSNIEYVKMGKWDTQSCPEGASKCSEVFGYVVDALVFSNRGWVNGGDKAGKVLYVSKTKKLYTNPLDASLDKSSEAITDITYKSAIYEVSGHSNSTSDCYIYGLYCPDDYTHQHHHESITFSTDAKVKAYTSTCDKTVSDDGYTFYDCKYGDYTTTSIKSVLK